MSLENIRNIVLVLSGKGGVGKSSITTQLALSLSLAGHSVGILDIDLTGPSIPRLLGIESAKVTQAPGGWLPVEVHAPQTLPPPQPITYPTPESSQPVIAAEDSVDLPNGNTIRVGIPSTTSPPTNGHIHDPRQAPFHTGSLHAMSLAFLLASRSAAVVWRGPKKTAMVRQFLTSVLWPPTDYLLIDTPPGTSDEHISLVETLFKDVKSPSSTNGNGTSSLLRPQLAGAVIVTTPQAVAISDVRKELNFCQKTGVKVLGVVENMSGYVCECCGVSTNLFSKGGGEVMAREFGVPFLGAVPVDAQWGLLVEQGKRPRYGSVTTDREEMEESVAGVDGPIEDMEQDLGKQDGEEDLDAGLLVDKYRNCSLCPIFEEITKQVIERVESGTAVSVIKPV